MKKNKLPSLIHFGKLLLLFVGLSTCASEEIITRDPTSSPATSQIAEKATSTALQPILEHRIGVRVIDGNGEFYDRETGEKFVPRGNNYIRIEDQTDMQGNPYTYHSNFNTDFYDRAQTRLALEKMSADGYNMVRVFINHCCSGGIGGSGQGLSSGYMDNVTDFLNLAKEHGLFVFFAQDWLPSSTPYSDLINAACCDEFNFINTNYLPKDGVLANVLFFQHFVQELINRDAALDYIFAYGIRNEFYFDSNYPPLSLTSGSVTTANGITYDMSSAADKQSMMDAGLVYFIDEVRAGILELDPSALVTIGFFWPQEPNPARIGDPRVINTYPAIAESTADFIDLHLYPGAELTLIQYVENYRMDGLLEKPIVMGEFGAFTDSYSSAEIAAKALHDWQVESCNYGFDGWLLWTWDTWEQTELFNGLDDGGLINDALSPINRPDPCIPGEGFEVNIALGKTVTASMFTADSTPEMAIDGLFNTWWGAEAGPTQWIQIDLLAPSTVTEIRLLISQFPAGNTVHRIRARSASGEWILLVEFSGSTDDSEWLVFTPEEALENIQFIRIDTVSSPSWVAWREIEIIGSQ